LSYRIFSMTSIFFFEVKNIWLQVVSKLLIWIRNDWQHAPCGMSDKRRVYSEPVEGKTPKCYP
ncbi:MAG: hypothetical protein SVR08_17065, partial [Spirochaetota bacterium]|nr:hypothetical protein [Spirochaetota bacterium]